MSELSANHHQGEPIIAAGEITPDQDHGRAGGDPEQNAASQITPPQRYGKHLDAVSHHDVRCPVGCPDRQIEPKGHLHEVNSVRTDEAVKKCPKTEQRDGIHCERLNRPIHKQGEQDRFGVATRPHHLGKVNLDHDGIHHEEETHGNGNRHYRCAVYVQGRAIKSGSETRGNFAEQNPARNTERYPERKVPFKDRHVLGMRGGRTSR